MANTSARRGASWERELREGLRGEGFDVESLRLAGREDEGDMVVRSVDELDRHIPRRDRIVIEAKNVQTLTLASFVAEAVAERENYSNHRGVNADRVAAVAIVKRRGKGWKDAYVVTSVREYFGLK